MKQAQGQPTDNVGLHTSANETTMGRTLYDKIWDEHVVHTEEDGTAILYIDRHLVHEVTSPQAFEGCLLYTSPSPRDRTRSRMPSSA